MHNSLAFAMFLGVSTAATTQPTVVTVELANFSFSPSTLQLKGGAPTTLHLHNVSRGGHNFSAPEFFAAAKLDPKFAGLVRNGTVEVPGSRSVDIALVPAAGSYRVKCTHTLHSTFGMKGTILVR